MCLYEMKTRPDLYSFFTFYYLYITHQCLNMLKLKRDINQQYFYIDDLPFVKFLTTVYSRWIASARHNLKWVPSV